MKNGMKHSQKGFTLVELLVTMVIFMIVIVAVGNIFATLLGNFKQQSRIVESNIEGNIGLQILRHDIEQAGYGLPWDLNSATYTEAGVTTTLWTAANLNDGPPSNPARGADTGGNSNPPGAIRSGNNYNTAMPPACVTLSSNRTTQCSDVLTLKGLNIGINATVQKWTYVLNTGGANYVFGPVPTLAADQFTNNEKVIVVRPEQVNNQRLLISTGNFYANFNVTGPPTVYSDMKDPDTSATQFHFPAADSLLTYIIYGISPSTITPIRPFNRADYYVRRPATGMPSKCEPSTGILYKAILSQTDDTVTTELPLLDCVADMQLVFGLDTNGDGVIEAYSRTVLARCQRRTSELNSERSGYTLLHMKDSLICRIPIRIPILPIQRTADQDKVVIDDVGGLGLIKKFTVPNRNYRWKLYTMIITPYNLR